MHSKRSDHDACDVKHDYTAVVPRLMSRMSYVTQPFNAVEVDQYARIPVNEYMD